MNTVRRLVAAVTAFMLITGAGVALAEPRDPLNYPLRQWVAVLGMTLIGGFAGWYVKVRKGEVPAKSLFALVGEMTISALAGALMFFMCDYIGMQIGFTAAAAGLGGYMGGRAIDMLETLLLKRAGFVPDRRKSGETASKPVPIDEQRP
jgi:hypothetical protein